MEPPRSGLTCPSTDGLRSGRGPPLKAGYMREYSQIEAIEKTRSSKSSSGLAVRRVRVFVVASGAASASVLFVPRQRGLSNPGRGLRPVSLPDASQMQGPARAQMEARQTALMTALAKRFPIRTSHASSARPANCSWRRPISNAPSRACSTRRRWRRPTRAGRITSATSTGFGVPCRRPWNRSKGSSS